MKKRRLQTLTLQLLYGIICRNVLRFVFHVKFNKTGQLNREKQFIIIANHSSHMDTVCLLSAMPVNKIVRTRPVAAQDYFGKNKFKTGLSNFFVNTVLINRKISRNIKEESIDKVLEALNEGYSLIFYPEGTRGASDKIQDLKKGIAHILAARPDICYIPVQLRGMKQLLSVKNIFKPVGASVTFGAPVTIQAREKNEIMVEIENELLNLYISG